MPLGPDDAAPAAQRASSSRRGSLVAIVVASVLSLGVGLWLVAAASSQDPAQTSEPAPPEPAAASAGQRLEPAPPPKPDPVPAPEAVPSTATSASPSSEPTTASREPTPTGNSASATNGGRLDRNAITSTIRTKLPAMRDCYNEGLRRNPKLSGTIPLRFVIGQDGTVTSVDSTASKFPDPAVVRCVAKQIRGLVFPKPEGGPVTVNYPFAFREQ